MGMWFKNLGFMGYTIAFAMTFVTFVMLCVSVTTSWNNVTLSGCTSMVSNATVGSPDISLYTQPRLGMCSKLDAINVDTSDCFLWSKTDFWKNFDSLVGTGNKAQYEAATTMPDIYHLNAVLCVLAFLAWVTLLLHWIKGEWVSRWMAQLVTGVICALIALIFLYASIAVNTAVTVNSENWRTYFSKTGTSCSKHAFTTSSGTETAILAFLGGLFTWLLVNFPTCCGSCGMCASEAGSEMQKGLIDTDERNNKSDDYIPPIV